MCFIVVYNFSECSVMNVKPEVHREFVCIEPVMIEGEYESHEMDQSDNLSIKPDFLHIKNENDIDVCDKVFNYTILPVNEEGIRLPRHIKDVSLKQQQQIIQQYSDMNCDFCEATFQSFDETIQHYEVYHNKSGFVKCCSLKWTKRSSFNWHIVWHLNAEVFK